jgi:hypothetical protein
MSFARLRALIIIGVLVLCAAVLVTVAIVKDKQANSQVSASCSPGDVPADLSLPEDNATVKLNVFNATDLPRLASQVADDFRSRKFTIVKEANDPAAKAVDGVAQLRYGPKSVGAAWLVRAHFLNRAELIFDINRKDDVIDVVLGVQFRQLGTTTEKNQALGQAGNPTLPPGTCDANS